MVHCVIGFLCSLLVANQNYSSYLIYLVCRKRSLIFLTLARIFRNNCCSKRCLLTPIFAGKRIANINHIVIKIMDDPMIVDLSSPMPSAAMEVVDKENSISSDTLKPAASSSSLVKSTKMKDSSASGSSSNYYAIPWVEKFRPRTLDDVLGNVETVIRLRAIAKDGNLPNLILCGPPGTGTLIL